MMWGHTWAVTNPLTIATVVSRAQYRATAGGVTYVFNKVTVFMGIFCSHLYSPRLARPTLHCW
jgi:hypothetical protein